MNRADLPTTSTIRRRGTLVVPVLVVLLSPFLIAAGPAGRPSTGGPAETVWVCKYVQVPGTEFLTLAPGQNPLRVDVNSIGDGTFNDAHHSLVLWDWDSEGVPDCVALNPLPQPDPDQDPECTAPQTPVDGVCTDPTPDPDPAVLDPEPDPGVEREDEAVAADPGNDEEESTCVGSLSIRIADVLGEHVAGASVALNGVPQVVPSGTYDIDGLPCGDVSVELETVPEGYVFVRTEIDQTATYSARSAHTKSRKVSATVDQEATSTVLFVVDPLEVMPEEITEVMPEEITQPAPERDPLGAPNPAPAQDDPQPAPQPSPVEPVAATTLPRTGIPAGRLLTLAILMLTAGGAMLGSRRSVDR